jgi:Domain of unknown function (DUF4260)
MTAQSWQIESIASPLFAASPAAGETQGRGVRTLLRLEGLAALAVAMAIYANAGFSWPLFALLFLAPDVAMLGYVAGPRIGALTYNFAHTYVFGLALAVMGFFGGVPIATTLGLIWIGHIGFDRALGYGLKYPIEFADTHLSLIGRR